MEHPFVISLGFPLTFCVRLSGSFTSAQNHKPHIAAISTPLPCPKNTADQCAAEDPYHRTTTAAQKQQYRVITNLRCTPQHSSTASKPHRPYQVIQEAWQVSRIATPHNHDSVGQCRQHIPQPKRQRLLHRSALLKSTMIRGMTYIPRLNIHIAQRLSTLMKPTRTTLTRSASRNMRYWRSQM